MDNSILKTKFFIPKISREFVQRNKLTAQIQSGLHKKLTLLTAPAGFGKTTLLSEWISSYKVNTAWLSLEERDNDFNNFILHFLASIQTRLPELSNNTLDILHSQTPPDIPQIISNLINELIDILSSEHTDHTGSNFLVIVLDDYHLIEKPFIHKAVSYFIEHIPSYIHIVLSGRTVPSIPMAQLRAQNQLSEITFLELRFSQKEAAAFLNNVMHLDLTEQDITKLESITEGWIAGLQLAALTLQKQSDRHGFIQTFTGSNKHVIDYLMDEVLEKESDENKEFLIKTSLLDYLHADLCTAICGEDFFTKLNISSQDFLQNLEEANLFIVPMDYDRLWYRYHNLFRDSLKKKLHVLYAKEIPTLYRHAAEWCVKNDWIAEAIHYHIAAEEFIEAAELIEKTAQGVLSNGDVVAALPQWMNLIPEKIRKSRINLNLVFLWTLIITSQWEKAIGLLNEIEELYDSFSNEMKTDPSIIGQLAAASSTIAMGQQDAENIILYSHQALEHLDRKDYFFRCLVLLNLGTAYYMNGDLTAAKEAYQKSFQLGSTGDNTLLIVTALGELGKILRIQGKLNEAVSTYQQAINYADKSKAVKGKRMPSTSYPHYGLARIYYEWNQLDDAQLLVEKSIQLSKSVNQIELITLSYTLLARIFQARMDLTKAESIIIEAENLVHQSNPSLLNTKFSHLLIAKTRLWLDQKRYPEIIRLKKIFQEDTLSKHDLSLAMIFTRAEIFIGESTHNFSMIKSVINELKNYYEYARETEHEKHALEIQVIEALAFQALGEESRAVNKISDALISAEPEGYIRLFINEGEPVKRLLKLLGKSYHELSQTDTKISKTYLNKLLNAFHAIDKQEKLPSAGVDSLSRREQEILEYLVNHPNSSNKDITNHFSISVNTTKTHLKNIFQKLNVTSREEAIKFQRKSSNL